MPNTPNADDILSSSPDNGKSSDEAEWYNVEDVLYQKIIITRANVADRFDQYSGKNKTYAYVNFIFADDPEERPFVFRTGWSGIRGKVARLEKLRTLAHENPAQFQTPYPVECGVVEILTATPFTSDDGTTRYPLDLVPFAELDRRATEAEEAMNAPSTAPSSASPTPAPTVPEPPAPTRQPPDAPTAPAARTSAARPAVAKAGNGSANVPRRAHNPAHDRANPR